jgi:hypothetical protein
MRLPLVGTHTLYAETLEYVHKRFWKYLKVIDQLFRDEWIGSVRDGRIDGYNPPKTTWSVVNRVYGYADVVTCPSGI